MMDGLAIAAALTEIQATLTGGIVRTVYRPHPETFVVRVFAGENRLLLLSPRRAAIHLTSLDFAYPKEPSPFTMLLRKHLRGARITDIRQPGFERAVTITVRRRHRDGTQDETHLVAELLGVRGNLVVLRGDRVIASLRPAPRARQGAPYTPLPSQGKTDPRAVRAEELAGLLDAEKPAREVVSHLDGIGKATARALLDRASADGGLPQAVSFILNHVESPQAQVDPEGGFASFFPLVPPGEPYPSFCAALDAVWEEMEEETQAEAAQRPLRSRIERAIAKREGTVRKLEAWLEDAEQENTLRRRADLLLIHQSNLSRRLREAHLPDPESGEEVVIPLDPRKSPVENAQALYERAKRLRRGRPVVTRRLTRTRAELHALRAALSDLEGGEGVPQEILPLLPPPKRRPRVAQETAPRRLTAGGYQIEVGKSAAQNDALLRAASPNDLWLHAKDVPGSHVIVRHRGSDDFPPQVVRAAARQAALHSKAKGERFVEVSATRVKHVRKPHGAPPGLVILSHADTLTVDLEREEG
jgi:predicted ribosome quality control (RQC) complex YloA/Tae2 family protein